jgi:flagellar basal-body rod modification protein FlgD
MTDLTTTPTSTTTADALAALGTAATSTTPPDGVTNATPKYASASATGMDKDGFLKILVEQMRHQDPNQPGDSQQYVTQLTQYSILEQLTNLNTAVDGQRAVDLIGRTVSWQPAGKAKQSGTVESVQESAKGTTLTVSGIPAVDPADVVEVR